jgi:hypothetical protein
LPVVIVCANCNGGFSKDEEYFAAFLSSVVSGNTNPASQKLSSASRALRESLNLRARIERSKTSFQNETGNTRLEWKPELDRIERVSIKNARGHAFFELGEPLLEKPSTVVVRPRSTFSLAELARFEQANVGAAWPEVGSRMLTRVACGHDMQEGWITVQESTYRYSVAVDSGIQVRSVLSEYLAVEVSWE